MIVPGPTPAAWHSLPPADVAALLDTDLADGLTQAEAARRLETIGPNRLPPTPRRTALRMFLDQFSNLLVAILLAAAILAGIVGDLVDAAAIVAIVFVNAAVGYLQERRTADALAALRRITTPIAHVRRNGTTALIPAAELVPGDVVVLEAGDPIPSDLRLWRASGLRAIEATLTGESEPVDKDPDADVPRSAPLADRITMTYMGTTVAAGFGEGIVVGTGPTSELGRIAHLVEMAQEPETPLQTRLRVLGRRLVLAAMLVVTFVFLLGMLRSVPFFEMILTSLSLAVAAVPEGLPAVVTIALALGVQRLARKKSLIRKLAAVETLGCTTVICADKTGTLTLGHMSVRAIDTLQERLDITEDARPPAATHSTIWAAVACSTARLSERNGQAVLAGDPTEAALLAIALRAGITPREVEAREPAVSTVPFDARRKRVSFVRRTSAGLRAYVKGAPESVLPLCTSVQTDAGPRPLGLTERGRIDSMTDHLTRKGLRVLAVASREMTPEERPEEDLTFLGLVGMHDPPRPEAKAAVEACRRAGIRPIMITGDNARTALAIAGTLGIAQREDEVITGSDLEILDDAALAERVESISVYARVSPEHKLRIVRAWKARGAVVAMTGDGVNDAPALKGADIGIAMGGAGTEVAKDAAAMIITDDNFATIVTAVEEGRAIFENIRKALLYLLSGNTAEILVMAVAVFLGWPLPLLAIQILWINLVTDSFPALALVTDPTDGDLLRRPPRRPEAEIADRAFLAWMISSAILSATVTLCAFFVGLHLRGSLHEARAYAFSTLVIEQVLRSFAFRSRTRALWEVGLFSNLRLMLVAVATIGFQLTIHHSDFLQQALKTSRLDASDIARVIVLAAIPVTLLEISKLLRRRVHRGARRETHLW
ncbi:MAG: cation-translocating P-type ATPase [Planctomycetes bacterium]|nr:cation-translocating P-type ATPase [Planctomycetota bacterium]